MSSTTSQSSPAFHSFLDKEKTSAETTTKLNLISSIWDDDHIRRIDEKNWQCLWCNQTFQGINANKALAHILVKKGIHFKSCYVAKDKAHTTKYQELQNYKQTQKGVLLDYSEKIRASITSLQNKSSSAIKSTIHRSSKSITSSNDTNSSVISGFSSASDLSSESNSRSFPNSSLIFGIDGNSQKLITSNDTHLTIAIADLIISEGLLFNLSQKPISKKVLELSRNVLKTYIPPKRNLISKELLDVIHEQNMKRNLAMIKKEAEIFGLLFLGDGATISICPLLNILASAKNISVAVLEIVDFQGHLARSY